MNDLRLTDVETNKRQVDMTIDHDATGVSICTGVYIEVNSDNFTSYEHYEEVRFSIGRIDAMKLAEFLQRTFGD